MVLLPIDVRLRFYIPTADPRSASSHQIRQDSLCEFHINKPIPSTIVIQYHIRSEFLVRHQISRRMSARANCETGMCIWRHKLCEGRPNGQLCQRTMDTVRVTDCGQHHPSNASTGITWSNTREGKCPSCRYPTPESN